MVGPIYLRDLVHGEALVGPVCDPWVPLVDAVGDSYELGFRNAVTGEITFEDSRLGPLPGKWRLVEERNQGDDPYRWFSDDDSGEATAQDPRLTIAALKERGVKIEHLTLV